MEVAMKKQIVFLVLVVFAVSVACQALVPPTVVPRDGTVVTGCANILRAVLDIQPTDIPQNLEKTGVKSADAFDANSYFKVLPHISMQNGYALDYVYRLDGLGSFPYLYARPADQTPYASMEDVPENTDLGNFRDRLEIEDMEQGYFEYALMDMLAGQFYLVWHANYNDTEIVCNRAAVDAIVEELNAGDFGMAMDGKQKAQVRAMTNIEPAVKLTSDSAIVDIVTFTKWGGFFRRTYTISRAFPHTVEMKDENLVKYDCGIMF
jgi:hypothetical protein